MILRSWDWDHLHCRYLIDITKSFPRLANGVLPLKFSQTRLQANSMGPGRHFPAASAGV